MERKRKGKLIGKQMLAGLLVIGMLISSFPVVSKAETATGAEEQFRQLYLRLLETGDYSQQDITDLNLPYMTCYDIIQDIKKNEGFTAYQCYLERPLIQLDEIKGSGAETYLTKFHLGEQEDTGFKERYARVKEMVAEVQANLDDKMTDLDKLLWINEYLVETLYYLNTDSTSDHLGGPTLFNGYGVCEGYAAAMMIFLKEEGITCETVSGGNHEWVAVQIDGEWYHVDPTWNDTRASRDGTHCFFMRNDNEFVNVLERKHTIATSDAMMDKSSKTVSTSTAYTNWYVHDVWNRMYYYNGYWYYVQDGAVKKNNIKGTAESIVYKGSNLTITGIENGILTVSDSKGTNQFDLWEKDDTTQTNEKGEEGTTDNVTGTEGQGTTGNAAETEEQGTTGNVTGTEGQGATGNTTETEEKGNAGNTTGMESEEESSSNSVNTQNIKVGRPVIKSVTNKKKKKIKIVLKKKVAGADGYEIKYSTNKKFKKSVKTVRFTGKTKTISKLKKNKIYYVKVRAYKKTADGKRVYGKYSSVKKVRIKK